MIRCNSTVYACLLLGALTGCGGQAGVATAPTAHPRTVVPTPTFSSATATVLPNTPLPNHTATAVAAPSTTPTTPPTSGPTPRPLPTKTASAPAPTLIAAHMRPESVGTGGAVTATVAITGFARGIEIYLSAGPGGAAPAVYTLSHVTGGNWMGTGFAPDVAGAYHYSVGLYDATGKRTIVDNDGWNIQVGNGTSSGVQPVPSGVPLDPRFSFGGPQAAVFSAEGATVNGSEVVSAPRTDLTGASVAHYYENQLPAAGWTLDTSTAPAPGATSFSLVATNGNQVCVVEYGGAAIHLFYGSRSG